MLFERRRGMGNRCDSHTDFQIEHFLDNELLKLDETRDCRTNSKKVKETCEAFEIRKIKGVVKKDYVHILASCPPTIALERF